MNWNTPWSLFRRVQLQRDYWRRREHYAQKAAAQGIVYREDAVTASVRDRLSARGYLPTIRQIGDVHTFAFVPRIGWHPALLTDLRELGPVTEFDYAGLGYSPQELWRRDGRAAARRREMNNRALTLLADTHAKQAVDWAFFYASGLELRTELLSAITGKLGIPTVNMCLDDKQSWAGPVFDGQRTGQVEIAHLFDISWTSAHVACDWYLAEGARPIYLPEGFDAATYRLLNVKKDIPISFVGDAYGFRPRVIETLRHHNIPIEVFGKGWNTRSVWGDEQVAIFSRSQINLGMGGIGYSELLTNVKTRDFEIPGTGGGVYLTSFNPDLAQHFHVGREILCYRSTDELVELARYYLKHADEAEEISRRGRERCLREHRWLHRYIRICEILGIIPTEP